MAEERKILSAFAPTVPMWAVGFNNNELFNFPIMAIVLVEVAPAPSEGFPKGTKFTYLRPLQFSVEDGIEGHGDVFPEEDEYAFLGYSLTPELNREYWEDEIAHVQRKLSRVQGKSDELL